MFAPCAYREADLATCELLSPSIRRGHEPAGDRVAVESGTFQRSLARPLLPPVYQLVLVVGSSGTENRRHKGSTWSVASCASSPGRESTNDALWISVGSRICQPSRPLPADTRTRSAVLYRGQCVLGWLGIGGSPLCARSLGLKEPPRTVVALVVSGGARSHSRAQSSAPMVWQQSHRVRLGPLEGDAVQFVSYPIGLLVGLLPIAVSLGPTESPAHLLLDGRPICEMTAHSQSCMADLGPDPRVHLLELVRTDRDGLVVERVSRWVNRPGIEPEVFASGGCDRALRECNFDLTWAHPAKLDPKRIDVQLDGAYVWTGLDRHVRITLPSDSSPQIVAIRAQFSDGTAATYTRVLVSSYLEEAHAALRMIPIISEPPTSSDGLMARLKAAGRSARTVDESEADIVFVFEPGVFGSVRGAFRAPRSSDDGIVTLSPNSPGAPGRYLRPPGHSPSVETLGFGSVRIISPDEALSEYQGKVSGLGELQPTTRARFTRFPDAVAAAGYALGSVPKRRAVVLVLGGVAKPNISSFSAMQVQAYLAEIMIPLVVWRVGPIAAPEWPAGPRIETAEDARVALAQLRGTIDRQRVAWFEGLEDTRYLGPWLAPGILIAGREPGLLPGMTAGSFWEVGASEAVSLGPDGGPVHAVGAAADSSIVYAGTQAGVFRSVDQGTHWKAASIGLPASPIRYLAVDKRSPTTVYVGTDVGFYRSADGGDRWHPATGPAQALPVASIALDPANSRVVYVGTVGFGVWRSDDAGATFAPTPLDHGNVRALAVNQCDTSLISASEDGVFKSSAAGSSLLRATSPAARVLSLLIESREPCRMVAGTSGDGLLVSSDGGKNWRRGRLDRGFISDIRADPAHADGFFAASLDGVLSSTDGGETWSLARVGSVESLVPVGGLLLAGASSGVLRRTGSDRRWQASNAGLAAQVAYSVAVGSGPLDGLYVGTAGGLLRASRAGGAWSSVPGVSTEDAVYAVASAGISNSSLLVGTSGAVGRSYEGGAAWSWTPTHSTFSLAVIPSRPDTVYAATRDSVIKSEDGGEKWSSIAEGLGKTFAYQLAVDAKGSPVLYAATASAGVFRRSDRDRVWKLTSEQMAHATARCIAIDPTALDTLYVGTGSGVFVTANGGRDWQPRFEGLPHGSVYSLLVDPRTPGTIFAGTAAGLFRTRDGAKTWSKFPAAGVPATVISLALDVPRNTLIAGTLGWGVFAVALGEP